MRRSLVLHMGKVQTKLSAGYEHATGDQGVWFGAYHWENLYVILVCLLLLSWELRGQEQFVLYPHPSTKRQTETVRFSCRN